MDVHIELYRDVIFLYTNIQVGSLEVKYLYILSKKRKYMHEQRSKIYRKENGTVEREESNGKLTSIGRTLNSLKNHTLGRRL